MGLVVLFFLIVAALAYTVVMLKLRGKFRLVAGFAVTGALVVSLLGIIAIGPSGDPSCNAQGQCQSDYGSTP